MREGRGSGRISSMRSAGMRVEESNTSQSGKVRERRTGRSRRVGGKGKVGRVGRKEKQEG
jgi:hypothetical protein